MDYFEQGLKGNASSLRMWQNDTLHPMEQISGYIERITFCSEQTGFTVARLKQPNQKDLITIVGSMPTINPGETLHCSGHWKNHPKHGRQFEVIKFELAAPVDLLGIRKYLESGMVKGIGCVYAGHIVKHFGTATLKVIDETHERLLEVPGIGAKRMQKIKASWDEQKGIRRVMIFLQSHRVSPAFAHKIFKLYGEESVEKVKANPYALAKDMFGVGFKTADQIARDMGIQKEAPTRVQMGIEHVLWELSQQGHVCYPTELLITETEKILEVGRETILVEIETLIRSQRIIEKEVEKEPTIWVRPLFISEMGITKELKRIQEGSCSIRCVILDKALSWAAAKMQIRFAKEQKQAIKKSQIEKLHVITGGPGTGKSTITRAILLITAKLTSRIILAAPTGRAAKRLGEITHRKAHTIHSLLEMNFQEGGFKKNKENPLKSDLLIIDEASMIDTRLMYHLLKAIPTTARVIFIGDVDQLPSVGPGTVLKDLIDSQSVCVTRLKQIFRQKRGSRIVKNAHRINAGYFPDLTPDPSSDFHFLDIEQSEAIVAKTIELIKWEIPKKFGLHPVDDIQVLSPMKRGITGVDHLNQVLQKQLNVQKIHLMHMGRMFQLYDKVMQIRNNYDKKVYNGDVGRIGEIDKEGQGLEVDFETLRVHYDISELEELVLAYAVSVHKYQGSECPCILMPLHTSHFKLLFRNLLYTGVTRGKKVVFLLGTKKALAIAIRTKSAEERFTGLKYLLLETFSSSACPEPHQIELPFFR